MAVDVQILPEARAELDSLPQRERDAVANAIYKLQELGDALGYPHSSQVQGTALRELRPRQGRSPWRAFYLRRGNRVFVVAAVGSEAVHNPRRFHRAIADAQARLAALEPE